MQTFVAIRAPSGGKVLIQTHKYDPAKHTLWTDEPKIATPAVADEEPKPTRKRVVRVGKSEDEE